MTEKQDKGLIGFDPLAWMSEEDEDSNKQPEGINTSEETHMKEIEEVKEIEVVTKSLVDTVEPVEPIEPITHGSGNETDDLKITLDATLNIQNVSELYEQLSKRLNIQDIIEIDASAVVSIDTATLQLLIVLKQEAVKLHKEVIIDFPSDKFIEASELLGLDKMLEVDQAAAGFF